MATKKVDGNERVRVFIPRDRNDEQTYVVVGINGQKYQIQKGVEVYVPKAVKEVLDHSDQEARILDEKLNKLSDN